MLTNMVDPSGEKHTPHISLLLSTFRAKSKSSPAGVTTRTWLSPPLSSTR